MSIPELQMRPRSSCLHRPAAKPDGSESNPQHHLKYSKEVEELIAQKGEHSHPIKRTPTPFKGRLSGGADDIDDEDEKA